MKGWLTTGLITIAVLRAAGATNDVPALRLGMTQAVHLAVAASDELRADLREMAVAEGMRLSADALTHPTLESRVQPFRTGDGAGAGEAALRVTAALPLYRGGRTGVERDRARHHDVLAVSRVTARHRAVVERTRIAYCRLLLAIELQRVSETQTAIARSFLDAARRREARSLIGQP